MSYRPGSNNSDLAPTRKRQKRSGDDEKIAFGGPMYDEVTARKILEEVVLVSAEYAEEGEAVIGFNPDDAALDNLYSFDDDYYAATEMTPVTYFAEKGDAKMCRYLVSRGASTTKSSEQLYPLFPMYAAAEHGYLDICKVFYAKGAQSEVRRDDGDGWTPFAVAARNGRDEVVRWLTVHGALCESENTDEIEGDVFIYPVAFRTTDTSPLDYGIGKARQNITSSCKRLIEWAKEVTQTHSALIMFLLGTLPPAPDKARSCTLQCLSGLLGVRKHIGDFVGLEVTKGKQLRILRNVQEVLPSLIER